MNDPNELIFRINSVIEALIDPDDDKRFSLLKNTKALEDLIVEVSQDALDNTRLIVSLFSMLTAALVTLNDNYNKAMGSNESLKDFLFDFNVTLINAESN